VLRDRQLSQAKLLGEDYAAIKCCAEVTEPRHPCGAYGACLQRPRLAAGSIRQHQESCYPEQATYNISL